MEALTMENLFAFPWYYYVACAAVLGLTYLLNTTIISVFYHRGLAHRAVQLSPGTIKFVSRYGIWLTGLDPKGWITMHRLHHKHSDTPEDPHSPVHFGIIGVMLAQLKSYEKTMVRLYKGDPEVNELVRDLPFEVNAINRHKIWWMPYALHAVIGLAIAVPTGMWLLGAVYFAGLMTHPFEGWIVNAFGHYYGGRNFEVEDNSRNNHIASWVLLGEGFQNNHHAFPASAKFSYKPIEVDLGFVVASALEKFGVLKINRETLIEAQLAKQDETGIGNAVRLAA